MTDVVDSVLAVVVLSVLALVGVVPAHTQSKSPKYEVFCKGDSKLG